MFIIITISFFFIRIAPGGPFDKDKRLPPEIIKNIERKYHLDEPLFMQYARYMLDILKGDLGPSYAYPDHDVNYFISRSLPKSMFIGVLSLCIAVIFGIGVSIVSAVKQNSWIDYTAMSVAVFGITVPLFVVGPLLMYIFAIRLHWLPTSGWIDGKYGWVTLIMPVITLSLPYFAYIARLSRASILEILRSDYVRTARAKGLSEPVILFRHVLKGSLLPVVSYLGPAMAGIVTGSVVVEKIFRIPGIGHFFVQAAFNRDYLLLMGTVIIYAVILLLANFVVDILYGFLDPRISYK
jgi:oligopeptide transport system permease protein